MTSSVHSSSTLMSHVAPAASGIHSSSSGGTTPPTHIFTTGSAPPLSSVSASVGSSSYTHQMTASNNASMSSSRPVPMKLFATWEVDRTPPNCIPRLCTLTLTRIVLTKPLGADLNAVIIAVKMQSSKRTLRSNEIELPPNGLLDTELQLTFSLQYPHFLKREGNQLHIMLQRRKRYKNRTILGFKTLATGTINMSQVLQKQLDLELELFGDLKEKTANNSFGKVFMLALSSQPVDHEVTRTIKGSQSEGADRDMIYSDEDLEDYSSGEEGSDSEPLLDVEGDPTSAGAAGGHHQRHFRHSKSGGKANNAAAARQRNLKQKFVALLKKFKVTDPDVLEQEEVSLDQKLSEGTVDPAEIEDLFDELEDFSDSGPDVDNISVDSTPKPSLKPFFNSSRSLLNEARAAAKAAAKQKAKNNSNSSDQDYGGIGHGSDRQSDDSSKEGISDSHPETLTDPEGSDPQMFTSSPPHSGDELMRSKDKNAGERRTRLFSANKDKPVSSFALKQQKLASGGAGGAGGGAGGASGPSSLTNVPSVSNTTGAPSSSAFTSTTVMTALANRVEKLASASSSFDSSSPRKVLLEQLGRVLPGDIDTLPDQIILANTCDRQGAHLAAKLAEHRPKKKLICTAGSADVRATLTCLVAKIQKFCNTKTQTPPSVKVVLIGSDMFVNSVLRPYVEIFSAKPPDWQGYLKFYIIPLGNSFVSKTIGIYDPVYGSLFLHDSWRDLLDKAEPSKSDVADMVYRIDKYTGCSGHTEISLPIAEAMVTYKERSSDEESSQVFVPFICDVRVSGESPHHHQPHSFELEEPSSASVLSTSAPTEKIFEEKMSASGGQGSQMPTAQDRRLSPPSSPHFSKERTSELFAEPIELQLDYWLSHGSQGNAAGGFVGDKTDSKKGVSTETKNSIKTSIRYMIVQKNVQNSGSDSLGTFNMQYWVKEKKPKAVMRLGKKKDKDSSSDVKSQNVDGISRLICLSKAQTPLRVMIDGSEWSGVKFFQLSSQWQTHIKGFPVAKFDS